MPRTMRVKSNKKRGRTMKNKKRGKSMKNKKRGKSMKKGRRGRSMKKRSRRGKKGGSVLAGVGGIVKEAVVPVLLTGAVLSKGKKSKSRKSRK